MSEQGSLAFLSSLARKPQLFVPVLVVVGMVAVAFGVQPGSGKTTDARAPSLAAAVTATASATASATAATAPATSTRVAANLSATPDVNTTADVAGVRATPAASISPEPDLSHETTQCGTIQESSIAVNVQQVLSGVSIAATRAAIYPGDYFRCILMATGGREALSLASSIARAQRDGATHVVLVDLWITNSGRDFGQVNLKPASLAVAGKTFAPLATLGGRSEVVVSSGQGRNVTLVIAITNGVGATTGPMTLTVDAPMVGGKQTAGKFQLFLPTP